MKVIFTLIYILISTLSYCINTDSLYSDSAYLAKFNKELNIEFTRILDSILLSNYTKFVESKRNELKYKFIQKKEFNEFIEINYPNGYEPFLYSPVGHNIAKSLSEMYLKDFLDIGTYRLFNDSVEYAPSHYKIFSSLKEYSTYFDTENTGYLFTGFVISIGRVIPDIFKRDTTNRHVFDYKSDNVTIFAKKRIGEFYRELPEAMYESVFANTNISFDENHDFVFILIYGLEYHTMY